jgi:hypothetical protein
MQTSASFTEVSSAIASASGDVRAYSRYVHEWGYYSDSRYDIIEAAGPQQQRCDDDQRIV